VKDLALELAVRFYEIHERLIFLRTNFASTSLKGKLWKDLPERDRLEYIEAFRQLLADQKLMDVIKNRSEL